MSALSTIFQSASVAILSKKQAAVLSNVASMDADTRSMALVLGDAGTRRAIASDEALKGFQRAMEGFQRDGCRNVGQFARLINSYLSQYSDSDKLTTCPQSTKTGFYEYPASLKLWASGDLDKTLPALTTLARRQEKAETVGKLISFIKGTADSYHAAAAAAAAAALKASNMVDVGTVDASTVDTGTVNATA